MSLRLLWMIVQSALSSNVIDVSKDIVDRREGDVRFINKKPL